MDLGLKIPALYSDPWTGGFVQSSVMILAASSTPSLNPAEGDNQFLLSQERASEDDRTINLDSIVNNILFRPQKIGVRHLDHPSLVR